MLLTRFAMQHCYLLLCVLMCVRVGVTESLISGNRPGREQGGEQEEEEDVAGVGKRCSAGRQQ